MVNRAATPEQKLKAAEYQRNWREKNQERWQEIIKPARKKWKDGHRAQERECRRAHRFTVRREVLVLIGGALCCQHCGYSDWRALQIDHRNGGGKHDARTRSGNTNLWALRNWLLKNQDEGRKLYQVLCANCNWIKRHTNDEHSDRKLIVTKASPVRAVSSIARTLGKVPPRAV